MRRISTFILLLLMLTFSVHPVLSLHFCGEELMSLNIGVMNNDNTCCMPSEIDDNEHLKFATLEVEESESCCCATTNIEVVTDNFIASNSQSIESPTESSLMPGWFILSYLVDLTASETAVENYTYSPTEGSYIKTLDFLSLVCIYRL